MESKMDSKKVHVMEQLPTIAPAWQRTDQRISQKLERRNAGRFQHRCGPIMTRTRRIARPLTD